MIVAVIIPRRDAIHGRIRGVNGQQLTEIIEKVRRNVQIFFEDDGVTGGEKIQGGGIMERNKRTMENECWRKGWERVKAKTKLLRIKYDSPYKPMKNDSKETPKLHCPSGHIRHPSITPFCCPTDADLLCLGKELESTG